MEVAGGSYRIATTITDLYSMAFRSQLTQWLKSIPYYVKPFDFVFEPLSKMMRFMADDLIAPAHKQACLIEKREFVVIDRTRNVPCNTKLGQELEDCKQTCTNQTEAECWVIKISVYKNYFLSLMLVGQILLKLTGGL